jgi:hypothetical protein
VKERSILFSGEMVRAILAGRKTQTRRVVRYRSGADLARIGRGAAGCPYGQPGDQLWVRETWYCDHYEVQTGTREADGARELLYYRATDCAPDGATYTGFSGETMRNPWRPSIHMPRWASRITLELTSVRVERLQDISEEDAWTEGVTRVRGDLFGVEGLVPFEHHYPQDAFAALWHVVNPKHPWNSNPWVWVLGFKRVEAQGVAA